MQNEQKPENRIGPTNLKQEIEKRYIYLTHSTILLLLPHIK